MPLKVCESCGKQFTSARKTAKFCSSRCRYHSHLATKKRVTVPSDLRFTILRRDKFRCRYCGASPTRDAKGKPKLSELRVDHVVSVEDGGALTDKNNLVTTCFICNAGKGKRSLSLEELPPHGA